ncbi:hypothetical protein B7R54_06300 [Subtercola boreus]|uniref:Luciferase-like domain-containing protein n=1 Tax=Subtercola boreus TaxID=120213 RepID=A0A3E0VHM8_9MICO|nr:LLM class flavin-dependent oxidoreductase [Subtercola boreus]RFA08880.1 hypothetical protein B7R54_06300 [Subtercola boreus]TQL54143.1 alkanesulfonate monooxygenase SsuD/methylene tetrahydromethanopterin reductase-like flavin-dependent oxidoreductase (luciferase family) [Subtercola boreus]
MQLSFLSFIPNHAGPAGAAAALENGLQLFRFAEELGYDTGWVRVRHFEPYLSSPMTFLAAVSQRTSRMHFGTGVLPMRYEDPIRVAEDASTLDLLSGGRLELGLSSGIPTPGILDPVFGSSPLGFSAEAQKRVLRLRAALEGAALVNSGSGFMSIPADTDLRVSPSAPGLPERLWYGAGTVSSAARTGAQGFDLQVSTLNSEETGVSFEEGQLAQIRAYREAYAARGGRPAPNVAAGVARNGAAGHPVAAAVRHLTAGAVTRDPRITAGRIIVPLETDADRAEHRAFIEGYRSGMYADGRHHDPNVPLRFSRIFDGSPERITDDLLADRALAESTQLMVTLPAEGSLAAHKRILRTVAERIAPHLGWAGDARPAATAAAATAAAAAPGYGTAA